MPGLVPGIHAFMSHQSKDVDGRVKPGHDDRRLIDRHPYRDAELKVLQASTVPCW
jgi:hypothetical protein